MTTYRCTEESPMPRNRDYAGDTWLHDGARLDTQLGNHTYQCSFCGHEFIYKTTVEDLKEED